MQSRFIALPYSDGKINYLGVKHVKHPECCRKETIQFLHDNFDPKALGLSGKERDMVRNNIPF